MSYTDAKREAQKRWRHKVKREAIEILGGECECCGETNLLFLQIHHRQGDGGEHRAKLKERGRPGGGYPLYLDIRKGLCSADDLGILCANCHQATTIQGFCECER